IFSPKILVVAGHSLRIFRIVEPQRAKYGHTGSGALMYGAIEVREKPVAQFEIFAADRLDLRIMQLVRLWNRALLVAADLDRTGIAGVPSPGQPQFPSASVATKEWTERAELKPAQIEFGSEFVGRNKTPNIRTPERNTGQRGINGDRHLRLQGLPSRVHVARP